MKYLNTLLSIFLCIIYLTTIGGPWYFDRAVVPQRLINQSLYQEILLLQKFNSISGKVLKPPKKSAFNLRKKMWLSFTSFKLGFRPRKSFRANIKNVKQFRSSDLFVFSSLTLKCLEGCRFKACIIVHSLSCCIVQGSVSSPINLYNYD